MVLFNHHLTRDQIDDAHAHLGVDGFVEPPEAIRELWRAIPPEIPVLKDFLEPVREWLAQVAAPGDFVLLQGDFGATWLMVDFALKLGLTPVYSTTCREATEAQQPDGSVTLTHQFRHCRFRRYGG